MNTRRSSKKSPSKSADKVLNEELQDNPNNLFPIVGIGASAGGVEAFTELLSHLPTNTGMAFVLIQHLAPDRESLLTTILARATQMPVNEAQDGMAVMPNQVYVIPPNTRMTIAQGVLHLVPRDRGRGQFMSVDAFFVSLAAERGNKAIGVVLSGGDSDGARGLEEIKAADGITFAQCQDTARVNSMPNTAVATGQVDFILSPQGIAEELANISCHPYVTRPSQIKLAEEQIKSDDALRTIFSSLRAATGVDFTHYKQTTLKRRLLRRMALYKLERLEQYTQYLQDNPTEVTALYQDLLINVTSFFRDSEAFDALKSKVFPTIAKDKSPGSPIRVWVAGCSTGEEAYSIAICLLEYLAEQVAKPPTLIYATDVSEMVIERARSGFYTLSQVADVSPERLQRFFVQVEGGYQICKAVREQCVFARQNLISDPPFSRLDLISCRNVLIYLGSPLQKKLLPTFHYGLKPTGFLMLGNSETVGDFLDLFALVDKKNKIYSRKLASTRLSMELTANNPPLEVVNRQPQVREDAQSDQELQQEADKIVLNQYAPAGVVINSDFEILQFRGQTSPYLQPAPGKASLNLLKMAKAELRLELRAAIHQAKKQEMLVSKQGLQVKEGEQIRQIRIDVVPFQVPTTAEGYFLVLFEDTAVPTLTETTIASSRQLAMEQTASDEQEMTRLRQELATTKVHLQSIIEEQQATNQDLRAANEEILSSNEELQSTNEELETAKEEIQATNEELNTVNDELHRRNIEANQINNDLQNLLSSTNIPILMLGTDLCIRRFTSLAQRIFNLISADVGRPLGDINHNLNLPDLEQRILEVINTLSVQEQEVQDREGRWYDLRIRPYRTTDNRIDGAVVIMVDIDALKRSAQLLQASRDYAEAIIETIREPLLVLDSNLCVLTANRSFYNAFQTTPAETQHQSVFELGNGQWNIPHLRSLLEEVLPQNHQLDDFEIEHVFERIGRKTMLLSACKILRTDNDEMILLAISDITERKLFEEQRTQMLAQEQTARAAAESANYAKDEFLSIISHELRSPLNSVLGWTQLLRNSNFDAAQTAYALEMVESGAKLQAKLVEDLLDISRITAGNLQLKISPITLVPVIEAALALALPLAEVKEIHIEAMLAPETLRVAGDTDRLQQVIGNLLANAIKFTPAGGRVTVKLERVGAIAQIQVVDTGQGISAEFLPHVFERFRQADSSSTRVRGGLGLGLAIVRHLVEGHRGTVSAASPGEGQGATFLVRLPLLKESREVGMGETEEISPPQTLDSSLLVGLRVLVVDDDAGMLELLTTILEQYGAQVTAVASAAEAIAVLNANPGEHDLLLSDISMPHEDGYALIRQVRALDAQLGGEIPAVALTAYVRAEEQSGSLAAGFQRYVTKPVEPAQLVSVIAKLAAHPPTDEPA